MFSPPNDDSDDDDDIIWAVKKAISCSKFATSLEAGGGDLLCSAPLGREEEDDGMTT